MGVSYAASYGLWHRHKITIGLTTVPPDRKYPPLPSDLTWLGYLRENSEVEAIDDAAVRRLSGRAIPALP